mmetsp:Transcript_26770/g.36868  ORF Transcript_26770/g.36868 Transcript_26770/m.36868 type:complete len:101 (+) Transcript_26770:400-702(+)
MLSVPQEALMLAHFFPVIDAARPVKKRPLVPLALFLAVPLRGSALVVTLRGFPISDYDPQLTSIIVQKMNPLRLLVLWLKFFKKLIRFAASRPPLVVNNT